MGRVVMHVDFDYFYVQCEELRRPELRGRPVCVCVYSGRGGDSGAVATASYAARRYGARSGIPISLAMKKLEGLDAEFLPVDFAHYDAVSESAMGAMRGLADVFEHVGRDEAYLDVTSRCGGDYARAGHLAQQLKNAVRRASGIGCSVGVSPSRLVSKIASDYEKPDGLTIVRPERVLEFLGPLHVRDVPGIGKKTEARLLGMGISDVAGLRKIDAQELSGEFGRALGSHIYNACRGIDGAPVSERGEQLQYSRISTLERDSAEYAFLSERLAPMCKDVHRQATEDGRAFRTVGVHMVLPDMSVRTKSRTLRYPTASLDELARCADSLLREALGGQVRRLGVRVSDLSEAGRGDITSYF